MRRTIFCVLSCLTPLLTGCEANKGDEDQAKKPRPVEIESLRLESPPTSAMVSASVASWKTEEIGFEVSGRIEWVAEPNTDIEGRVVDADGNELIAGTPIARVESERYELQVATAKAEVERAKESVNAAMIELEWSIPSQSKAAEAEKKLADTEYRRSQRLFQQNAGAQSDVDRDEANYQTALAKIEQINASKKAKEAEILSLRLQVKKAEQALRDAERNLKDCTLFSSFRGQIAEVSVVPGSVVTAGQPVATIQMMDPIKIELEVSAEDSLRLRKRQRIAVRLPNAERDALPSDGFLYLIDPVADPLTRTFTLTLLMLNKKNGGNLPPKASNEVPITDQTWPLNFSFLPGSEEGMTYVAEEAVHQDQDGYFLWRVENTMLHDSLPKDGLLKVSKLRIKLGESKLPFLGNWVFQQVILLDDSFDPEINLVAGKLTVEEGDPDDWVGDKILVDRSSEWTVRPGDLVKVDLSDNDAAPGFYVPMDAIAYAENKTFLFLVEQSTETKVKRTEVTVLSDAQGSATSSLMRIEPLSGQTLEGKLYVKKGVHYLRDDETVRVVDREGGSK